MHLRALIKLNAKRALRKNWSRAMAIAMILTGVALLFILFESLLMTVFELSPIVDNMQTPTDFIDDVPNIAPAAMAVMFLTGLLCFVVSVPLKLGAKGWFFKVGRGQAEDISSVFEHFSTFGAITKSVWLYLRITLSATFWIVLFLLPALSVVTFASLFSEQALSESELLLAQGAATAGWILAALCLVSAMIWCMRYFCAPYLLLDDPSISVRNAIGRSVRMTRGHRAELFKLYVSLAGWGLLSSLIFTRLFTTPIIQTVEGLYASYLIQLNQAHAAPAPQAASNIPPADAFE